MKRLSYHTLIYSIAPQVPRLINLFMLPILTTRLGAYDYGLIAIINSYLGAFDGIRDFGLSLVLTNSFFQDRENYKFIWARIYGFLSIWSVIFGILVIPIIYLLLPSEEIRFLGMIVLSVIIPIILFDTTSNIGNLYLQLNQKPGWVVGVSVVSSLSVVLGNYITVMILNYGYRGLLVSASIGRGIAFIIYILIMWKIIKIRPSLNFSKSWLKEKLLLSIPTIPHFYSGYILNMSDRVLLNIYKIPLDVIGLYSFAYSYGTYFSTLGKGLGKAATPIFLSLYKKNNEKAEKKVRYQVWVSQTVLLAAGFTIALWLKEFNYFLARNISLQDAYIYAIPVVISYAYYPIYFGAISKLRYMEKTKVFWKITSLAAIINIGSNLILIPLMGIGGAALSTLISYLYMAISGYWVKEFREINKMNYYETWWLLAIIGSAALAFVFKDASLLMKVFLTTGFGLTGAALILKLRKGQYHTGTIIVDESNEANILHS